MTHITAQPAFKTTTLDPADAAAFARIRSEILPARRRELSLTEFVREEYNGFRALGEDIPFLCRREWIPPAPQILPPPGSEASSSPVIIEFDPLADKACKSAWTEDVQQAARALLPRLAGQQTRAASFAEAVSLPMSMFPD